MKIATAVGISRDFFPVDSRLVLPFEQPMAVSLAIATDSSSLKYIHHNSQGYSQYPMNFPNA